MYAYSTHFCPKTRQCKRDKMLKNSGTPSCWQERQKETNRTSTATTPANKSIFYDFSFIIVANGIKVFRLVYIDASMPNGLICMYRHYCATAIECRQPHLAWHETLPSASYLSHPSASYLSHPLASYCSLFSSGLWTFRAMTWPMSRRYTCSAIYKNWI